jgi:hypothetical protein
MTDTDHLRTEAERLVEQGKTALLQGDQTEADQLLDQAATIYRQIGDAYAIAAQTGNYGWALRRAGQIEQSQPYLRRAAEHFMALGMPDFALRHSQAADEQEGALLSGELLGGLPPAVRGAIERGDGDALQFAINALPIAEQQVVYGYLVEAGIISDPDAEDSSIEALDQFAPLLQGIAAVARGDPALDIDQERAEIEAVLPDLARRGWQFGAAVPAIWDGQRDAAALTQGMDQTDVALVRRILELLG